MKRKASAVWNGDLKAGNGTISSGSGALREAPFSFKTRFEEGITGTNPDELIAAALASCFSMALSAKLGGAGHNPQRVATDASLELARGDAGFSIAGIHLQTEVQISGISENEFQDLAAQAKADCPVSRALSVPITLEAKLVA